MGAHPGAPVSLVSSAIGVEHELARFGIALAPGYLGYVAMLDAIGAEARRVLAILEPARASEFAMRLEEELQRAHECVVDVLGPHATARLREEACSEELRHRVSTLLSALRAYEGEGRFIVHPHEATGTGGAP